MSYHRFVSHVTGVTTDLGIIFFFGLGSTIGVFVFDKLGYMGFAIPLLTSGVLFTFMFYFQRLRPVQAKNPVK